MTAPSCTCRCTRALYVQGIGWVGCTQGVHCGDKGKGCGLPREGSR